MRLDASNCDKVWGNDDDDDDFDDDDDDAVCMKELKCAPQRFECVPRPVPTRRRIHALESKAGSAMLAIRLGACVCVRACMCDVSHQGGGMGFSGRTRMSMLVFVRGS